MKEWELFVFEHEFLTERKPGSIYLIEVSSAKFSPYIVFLASMTLFYIKYSASTKTNKTIMHALLFHVSKYFIIEYKGKLLHSFEIT